MEFNKNDMRVIKSILVRCSREDARTMQSITNIVYEYKTITGKGLLHVMKVIQYVYNRLNF